ncbi:MAG: TPM domain-containing protein [Bacteroidales bacterium]|jgi:uncharacterized protein|nr:TPM domain-containing protein [Bacteroidales bacterium]
MKKYLLAVLLSVSAALAGQEYDVEAVPNPKTADAADFVSNPDRILDERAVAQINSVLQSLEANNGAEVAVALLQSIGNHDIKDFAVRLFAEWGVGKRDRDNGLLILFVMDQRVVTFETGYGLEGVLPDAICKRIQMQEMIPFFKDGDYAAGILAGVERVAAVIRSEENSGGEQAVSGETGGIRGIIFPGETGGAWSKMLAWLLRMAAVFLFMATAAWAWMTIAAARIGRNKDLKTNQARCRSLEAHQKNMTTLFQVILVGGFILLLISLNWGFFFFLIPVLLSLIPAGRCVKAHVRKFRQQPFTCDCGGTMRLLSEEDDNKYLNPTRDFEEKIRSADYDVFLCDACRRTAVFAYGGSKSRMYERCPKCNTRAMKRGKSTVITRATCQTEGRKRVEYACKYCRHTENRVVSIPRLERSSSGSSSGGGSRSSGGSFGGGRSGGGGATSRW